MQQTKRPDLFDRCRKFTRHTDAEKQGLYPFFKAIQSGADAEVMVNGKKMIMIGSNNYLGLTSHPKVKEAAKESIDKFGTGCTGSRFLNGTLSLHEELEERLAKFFNKEACLLFSTGYQTGLGTLAALIGKRDNLIIDRMSHACIVDGTLLTNGKIFKFKHNDIEDLERALASLPEEGKPGGVMVVTEGVFSMEGDLGDLPKIVELRKKYDFKIMIDDAHGTGYMGPDGTCTPDHFGLGSEVDVMIGTFSKSFASLGGFVVAERPVIDYIKHSARCLIFSASMPPANVATVLAALDIMENEPQHRENLWKNVRKIQKAYREMGFNIGNTDSPVVPIIIGDFWKTIKFWRALFDEGVFVNPIIPPGVPPNMSLLRTSYMATHTDELLDRVIDVMGKIGKKLGVI